MQVELCYQPCVPKKPGNKQRSPRLVLYAHAEDLLAIGMGTPIQLSITVSEDGMGAHLTQVKKGGRILTVKNDKGKLVGRANVVLVRKKWFGSVDDRMATLQKITVGHWFLAFPTKLLVAPKTLPRRMVEVKAPPMKDQIRARLLAIRQELSAVEQLLE